MRLKLTILFFFYSVFCHGAFTGFPLASGSDYLMLTNSPYTQIYSGIVERCTIAGIAPPAIVENWSVFYGYNTNISYWTNGATVGAYTNVIIANQTITTTNQFNPFTSVDMYSTVHTNYPYITHDKIIELDGVIDQLIPHYLNSSYATNSWKDYFSLSAYTNDGLNSYFAHPTDIPEASKSKMFYNLGIGKIVGTVQTNIFGKMENDLPAYWTRQPPFTNSWVISETHKGTGTWEYIDVSSFRTNYFDDDFPCARYGLGGTNDFGSIEITIYGDVISPTNRMVTSNTTETLTITSTNDYTLGKYWHDITNISVSGEAYLNTNDFLSVLYTNRVSLYGDAPYVLYAEDINERWQIVRNLKHTKSIVRVIPATNSWTSTGFWSANVETAVQSCNDNWHATSYGGGQYAYYSSTTLRNYYDADAGILKFSATADKGAAVSRWESRYPVTNIIAHSAELYSYLYIYSNGRSVNELIGETNFYDVFDPDGIITLDTLTSNKWHLVATNDYSTIQTNSFDPSSLIANTNNPVNNPAWQTLPATNNQTFMLFMGWQYGGPNLPDGEMQWIYEWDFEYK